MSGGQRKRVTFADLVTARLPAVQQQAPNSSSPETGAASGTNLSNNISSPLARTPAEELSEVPERSAASDSNSSDVDSPSTPALKSVTESTLEENLPSRPRGDSQSHNDSQPRDDSQPLNVRRTFRPASDGQIGSQPYDDSQPRDDSQPHGDRQPLKEVKGYLRLPNTIVDSLLPTLDVYEQAVFVQLYRLSQGFGNYTCKISLPALQARTGVKATSLKQAIARLQARGIVEKISAEIGFGRDQGITYWVSQDGRQTYGDWQAQGGSQSPYGDNKRKEYSKETNLKVGLTPEQIKACPDCKGVGMWYPGGPGRGVARCYHPSLKDGREK
jgi:hypothetical protein